jgi:hypothetical protein
MGQLLMILTIPPLVGIITYALFRFIWEKDEQADRVRPVDDSMLSEWRGFGLSRPHQTTVRRCTVAFFLGDNQHLYRDYFTIRCHLEFDLRGVR